MAARSRLTLPKFMNSSIRLPNPARLRHTPARFSWLDHRLLREGHLAACASADALALYLVLSVAADARGVSYYSDKRLAQILTVSAERLKAARACLIANDLIAWRLPHYQLLCLDPETIRQARLRDPAVQDNRSAQTMSLQQVLEQLAQTVRSND